MIETLQAEKMEPLNCYSILMNDDHELMLVLPGYFQGEPSEAEFLYNGGKHAILARREGQGVVCDELNPEIQKWVLKNERVLVVEADSKQKYVAKVVRADVDLLTSEAIRLHDYEFRFHLFPTMDGTFTTGEGRCDYCGQTVKVFYQGPTEQGLTKTVCPRCIDDMAPAREGDGLFPGLVEDCRSHSGTLFGDTPPYLDQGRPGTIWAAHCGEPSIYLGELDVLDLNPELKEELTETWDHPFNPFREEDPEDLFKEFLEGDLTGHLFRCTQCRKTLILFYERD